MMRNVAVGAVLVSCATLYGCGDSPSPSPSPSPPSPSPSNSTTAPPAPSNSTTASPTPSNSTTASPTPSNSTTTLPTLAVSTTASPVPKPADLVVELNRIFVAWDPDNDTSPVGLLMSMGSPLNTPCNECDSPNAASDCRVSTALLNHKVSVPGKDMLFQLGNVGGFVYWPETVAPMVMCSYGMDGATDGRINHGCGCEISSACDGQASACPSACENYDPQTGAEFARNSTMFSSCHCAPGAGLDNHCFWEGPSFYHGEGTDELRSMVKQRYESMDAAATAWNEVVVDSQAHGRFLKQDAAGLIAAFVVPVNAMCDSACIRDLLAVRDATTQQLNLTDPIPVVGLNVDGGNAPFEEFEEPTLSVLV